MFKDFYEILEVDIEATGKQIKDSYRRLIKRWHPDLSSHPNAKSKSQEIIEAYLILSDTDAREKFDKEFDKFYQDQKAYKNGKTKYASQKLMEIMAGLMAKRKVLKKNLLINLKKNLRLQIKFLKNG